MSNYWIKALNEYNKDNKDEFCIPKKVVQIMLKLNH